LLFFYSADFILAFEILIEFTVTNSYSVLYHVFIEKFSVCFFSLHFIFLFEISVKSSAMSCYLILCSISEKDFLLAFKISKMQIFLTFIYNA